jgi:hypothetical protein
MPPPTPSRLVLVLALVFARFGSGQLPPAAPEGWRLLFDGVSTSGWRGVNASSFPASGWEVRDGALVSTGSRGGDIVTVEEFGDFDLRWEWRLDTKGGNGGLKYVVRETPGDTSRSGLGLEYQILDDASFEWMLDGRMAPNDYRTLAALYEIHAPSPAKRPRPLGEWNESRVVLRRNAIQHWLNGVLVLEADRTSADFAESVARSKFKDVPGFGRHARGRILLQDHGSVVRFRNVRIRELGDAAPRAVEPPSVLNDDGGWCWFQDERAVVVGGRLVFGSVASGRRDPARRGRVEATGVLLATGAATRFPLSATPVEAAGTYDDHDAPAFVVRGDGRLLAAWAGHGRDSRILSRVSARPADPSDWGEERAFSPSPSSRVTYSNLHRLATERGRIYDFFRGMDDRFKPSVAWSDDEGETWTAGGVVIDVPVAARHRPYVKYASDGRDTVHLAYTEGHPRDFDNGVWHVFARGGRIHRSDGTEVRPLAEGLRDPAEGTRVFAGEPARVAWVADLELDGKGRPVIAYSVQMDSAGLPPGQGGIDHRYRLARFTGTAWEDREIAYAGTRLYAGEDDYTGGIALVPGDPATVFVSTNADPHDGSPLVSARDGRRHFELFRGRTSDGLSWRWEAVTTDSTADNLRPIVPRAPGRTPLLLWLRGTYRSYTDYDLEVVGRLPD